MTRRQVRGGNYLDLIPFAKYAWFVLAFNIAVVLWGAYVRATGSGAGCGQHWPLCNGEVIPLSPGTAMVIEFSHRVMSGLTLLLVVALLVWALRAYSRGSAVRLGATLTLVFTITEALVGAGLVLFQLVAGNASMARAMSIGVHLTNTFLLLASITLTAWWASGGSPIRLRGQGGSVWFLGLGLVGVLILGTSGAVTALGDTLFPASSLAQGLQQDLNPTASFLIRLRVFHPFIAIAVGVYLILLARALNALRPSPAVRLLAPIVTGMVITQGVTGVLNVYLLAPVWLQLVHLLLADLVWIALVLLSASVLGQLTYEQVGAKPLKRVLEAIIDSGSET